MKHTTRILALLLALVLCLGLSVTAFATEGNTPTGNGSITINGAVKDQTYTIYRILELESYNPASGAYAYKAIDKWKQFLKQQTQYVTVDDQDYVKWIAGTEDTVVAAFAKAALAYAKENGFTGHKNEKATGATVTFNGLPLGYYLVDSDLGTLCALDTTHPNMTMTEKNGVPTNVKKVEENSAKGQGDAYRNANDAYIGETVNFQSTIKAQRGAEKYVFHDTMSEGLDFKTDSVKVMKNQTNATVDTDYTVKTTGFTDGCTFEVVFTDNFCNTLDANDTIIITYSATLNKNAVVGGAGNPNESKLTYGEGGKFSTTISKTITYTWEFDVLKIGDSDQKKPLENAQFVVLNHDASKVAKFTAEGKFDGWVNLPNFNNNEKWADTSVLTTNKQGNIHVKGLDSGNYKLREVKAPDGYNKLKEDKDFAITVKPDENNQTLSCEPVIVEVNNQSGTLLPSTGGMGTTIFYVLGGILAVGAAVLLVTKKRMERG